METSNEYVQKYGDGLGVFLITQCYVNGWPQGFTDGDATLIRDGNVDWEIKGGRLYVNNEEKSDAPMNWSDREKNYNEAMEII